MFKKSPMFSNIARVNSCLKINICFLNGVLCMFKSRLLFVYTNLCFYVVILEREGEKNLIVKDEESSRIVKGMAVGKAT
jgi:hypothetical protein